MSDQLDRFRKSTSKVWLNSGGSSPIINEHEESAWDKIKDTASDIADTIGNSGIGQALGRGYLQQQQISKTTNDIIGQSGVQAAKYLKDTTYDMMDTLGVTNAINNALPQAMDAIDNALPDVTTNTSGGPTGYASAALRGIKSGVSGVAGGLADFAGFDNLGNYLNEAAENSAANRPDGMVWDNTLGYLTDPQGAWYDAWSGLGSSLAIAPAAALVPEGVAAGGAGLLSRFLGGLGSRAAGAGMQRIGGAVSSWAGSQAGKNALKTYVAGGLGTAPVEAISEGGNVLRDAREQGLDNPEARAWQTALMNMPLLAASNGLEMGLLGGKLFNKKAAPYAGMWERLTGTPGTGAKRIASSLPGRIAPAIGAGMAQNAGEEFYQQAIQNAAMGNDYSFNPFNAPLDQYESAIAGAIGGGAMATPGAAVSNMKKNTQLSSGNSQIDDYISSASATYGVPANLMHAVADTESQYNTDAQSDAGAQGIMQLMPDTAAALGVEDPFDAKQSINGGARYLREMYDKYGNWRDALIAYNEGPGNFDAGERLDSAVAYADNVLGKAGDDLSTGEAHTYDLDIQPGIAEQLDGLTPTFRNALPYIGGILDDMGLARGAAISSAYRTPEHNAAVGGAENSYHTHGDAVDIVLPEGTTQEQADAVRQRFESSGAFLEVLFHDAGSGYHLHLGGYNGGLQGNRSMSDDFNIDFGNENDSIDFANQMLNSHDGEDTDFFKDKTIKDGQGRTVFNATDKNLKALQERYGDMIKAYNHSRQDDRLLRAQIQEEERQAKINERIKARNIKQSQTGAGKLTPDEIKTMGAPTIDKINQLRQAAARVAQTSSDPNQINDLTNLFKDGDYNGEFKNNDAAVKFIMDKYPNIYRSVMQGEKAEKPVRQPQPLMGVENDRLASQIEDTQKQRLLSTVLPNLLKNRQNELAAQEDNVNLAGQIEDTQKQRLLSTILPNVLKNRQAALSAQQEYANQQNAVNLNQAPANNAVVTEPKTSTQRANEFSKKLQDYNAETEDVFKQEKANELSKIIMNALTGGAAPKGNGGITSLSAPIDREKRRKEFYNRLSEEERFAMDYLDYTFENTGKGFTDVLKLLKDRRDKEISDYVEILKSQMKLGVQPRSVAYNPKTGEYKNLPGYSRNYKWYQELTANGRRRIGKKELDEVLRYVAIEHLTQGYSDPQYGPMVEEEGVRAFTELEDAINGLESIARKAKRYEAERGVSTESGKSSRRDDEDIQQISEEQIVKDATQVGLTLFEALKAAQEDGVLPKGESVDLEKLERDLNSSDDKKRQKATAFVEKKVEKLPEEYQPAERKSQSIPADFKDPTEEEVKQGGEYADEQSKQVAQIKDQEIRKELQQTLDENKKKSKEQLDKLFTPEGRGLKMDDILAANAMANYDAIQKAIQKDKAKQKNKPQPQKDTALAAKTTKQAETPAREKKTAQTGAQATTAASKAKERSFVSTKEAEENLLAKFGLKRKEEKPAAKKKRVKVVDDSDEALQAEIEKLKKGLAKMSANPFFDPDIMVPAFKVGMIYLQRGVNNFADLSEKIISVTDESVKPWLKSIWNMTANYEGDKLDEEKLAAAFQYVGARWDDGVTDLKTIRTDFRKLAGEEESKPYMMYIDTAYKGVESFYKKDTPVVELKENATQEGEAEENGIHAGESDRRLPDVSGKSEAAAAGGNEEEGERPAAGKGNAGEPERQEAANDAGHIPQQQSDRRLGGELQEVAGSGNGSVGTAERRKKVSVETIGKVSTQPAQSNYRLANEDELSSRSEKVRYEDNIEAIKLLKQLEVDGRRATPTEQKTLAKYSGWGGITSAFSDAQKMAELKELLTTEEYNAAQSSIQSAYYTAPTVVKSIWNLLDRLGFKGGRVLEPSMGVGNFFGLMPSDVMNKSSLTGVELDNISGQISKQLYQKADVNITGFEKFNPPDNYFDLVVGNVPFGSFSLHDPRYDKFKYKIHNYFFHKAMDKVRPGGLVVMITSTNTMSDYRDAEVLRANLNKQADLIGAIRLPDTAFKSNTGTSVVSDIIILQKREAGSNQKSEYAKEWMKNVYAPGSRSGLLINEYYVKNSQMIAGKLEEQRDRYSGLTLGVSGKGINLENKLSSIIKNLPEGVYEPLKKVEKDSVEATQHFLAPSNLRENSYTVGKETGKVYQNINGELKAVPKNKEALVKDFVQVKKVMKAILSAQIDKQTTDDQLKKMRDALNRNYDGFVKKHGYLNAKKNISALSDDPEFGAVSALEQYKEDKKTKKIEVKKADIFTERTVGAVIRPSKAENASDALTISLSQQGRVDMDYMSNILGRKPEEIAKELKGYIYKDPMSESYETADEYLSGDVRTKLFMAQEAAKTNADYKDNVEALKKVQPEDLMPEEITVNLGASWVPENDVRNFACELLQCSKDQVNIRYSRTTGTWYVDIGWGAKNSPLAQTTWGTYKKPFDTLLDAALNQKAVAVYKGTGKERSLDSEGTAEANNVLDKIKKEFSEWIWKDKDRTDRLLDYYNTKFNNYVVRTYDGSHLALPGYSLTAPKLRKHQKDAVWRIMQNGNTLLAHSVGAGKTWTMQTAAMEMRRLGICKKPMFVIPGHMIKQFENEWRQIYPNAQILTVSSSELPVLTKADKGNAAKKNHKIAMRQRMLSRIATEDWDGIIISHDMFKRIPMSPDAYNQFYEEQMNELEQAVIEINAAKGKSIDGNIRRSLEKSKKLLEKKLKRNVNEEKKDMVIPFEELGVDQIFVDEADLFKNLAFVTKMQRISGLSNSNNQRSMDMYVKTRYITKANHGRGVVFATGTPISNTMAEMFTMTRYMDEENLRDHDLQFFDKWASQFAEIGSAVERNPDTSGYRRVDKVTSFVNMPELIKMFRKFADVKRPEDLHLDVPKLKGGHRTTVSIEPGSALKEFIRTDIKKRAEKIRSRKVKPEDDNMLKLTNELRKASLDIRLINPDVPASEADGKIQALADNVYNEYVESNDRNGAQLIFCDLSTPKGTSDKEDAADNADDDAAEIQKFNVYDEIKKYLINKGIPKEQIAFIHDAKTKDAKQKLFDEVNEGIVRVLIGSTSKMGAGTNCQKKLVALHHLDCPWRPRDIEQREGRIIRQRNENKEVGIYNYVTKDSFDANMWEKVKNKQKMISQAMSGDVSSRTMEDSDAVVMSFAEAEALASGNPLMAEKTMVDAEVEKYLMIKSAFVKKKAGLKRRIAEYPDKIEAHEDVADKAQSDDENRDNISGENFRIELEGKTFTERKKAQAALEKIAERFTKDKITANTLIGNVAGFELKIRFDPKYTSNNGGQAKTTGTTIVTLVNAYSYEAKPSIQSVEYTANNMPAKVAEANKKMAEELKTELPQLEKEFGKKFAEAEKLNELLARQKEIDAQFEELADKKSDNEPNADVEETAQQDNMEIDPETGEVISISKEPASTGNAKVDSTPAAASEQAEKEPIKPAEEPDMPDIKLNTIDDAVNLLGVDKKMLTDFMSEKKTGSNINEQGKFAKLKLTIDTKKVMAAFHAKGFDLSPLKSNTKAVMMLYNFVLEHSPIKNNVSKTADNQNEKTQSSAKDDTAQATDDGKRYKKKKIYINVIQKNGSDPQKFGNYHDKYDVSIQTSFNRIDGERLAKEINKRLGHTQLFFNAEDSGLVKHYYLEDLEDAEEFRDEVIDIADEILDESVPEGFAADDYKHTKNNQILARATMTSYVPRPQYQQYAAIAKQNHGYFSSYAKGFLFESKEDRDNFFKAVQGLTSDDAQYSFKGDSYKRLKNYKDVRELADFTNPAPLTEQEQQLSEIAGQLGTPIVWYNGPAGFRGWHADGITYLNRDSSWPLAKVFWHETFHWMSANNPQLVEDLSRYVNDKSPFTQAQIDGYAKSIYKGDQMDKGKLLEEMMADSMEDTARRVGFFRTLGKKDKSLFKRLVSFINNLIKRFTAFFAAEKTPGLTPKQSRAMADAFKKMALAMTDKQGNKIFKRGADGYISIETNKKFYSIDADEEKQLKELYGDDFMDDLFDDDDYSARFSADNEKSIDSATATNRGALRRLGDKISLPKTPKGVTIRNQSARDAKIKALGNIGFIEGIFNSPSRLAEKYPAFAPVFTFADNAMRRLQKNRSYFAEELKKAYDMMGDTKKYMGELNALMFKGDTESVEFAKNIKDPEKRAQAIAKEQGVNIGTARAYIHIRSLLDKAYDMINRARQQVKVKSETVSESKLNGLKNNKFVTILKEEQKDADSYLVTYEEIPNWTKTYQVDAAALEKFRKDDAIQILEEREGIEEDGTVRYYDNNYATPKGEKINLDSHKMYTVYVRECIPAVNKLEGYVPHFFHDWFVVVKNADGTTTTIDSGRNVKEAVAKAKAYLKDNKGAELIIRPKRFDFGQLGIDEDGYAALVGDKQYGTINKRIADEFDMSIDEAKQLMNGKGQTVQQAFKGASRHRFFGNIQHRKGVKGYEQQDIDWVLRHYFNSACRYEALETEFKPKAISLFERLYGSFNNGKYSGTAKYMQDYINDVNGNPNSIEMWLNDKLNNGDNWLSKLWRKFAVSHFGDRAALQLAGTATNYISIAKLGVWNISSAMLNLSQLVNTTALLTRKNPVAAAGLVMKACADIAAPTDKGTLKRVAKLAEDERRAIEDSGVLDDMGLDAGAGYYKPVRGNLAEKSMYLFKLAEGVIRRGTVLAAYRQAKKEGKNYNEALDYAMEVNRKANFEYAVQDAPNMFRRGGIFSQILFQFQKYPIKQLELMQEFIPACIGGKKGSTTWQQKATFWGMYTLLGGAFSLPAESLLWTILDLILAPFGKGEPEKAVKKHLLEWAKDADPFTRSAIKTAMYGLPALVNIDVSQRVGMSDVIPGTGPDYNKNDNAIIQGMSKWGGAVGGTIAQLYGSAVKGDGWGMIRSISPGAYNIITAVFRDGTTDARGRITTKYDDVYSRIIRGMGFKSADESLAADAMSIKYYEMDQGSKEKKALIDDYLDAEEAGKPRGEILKELKTMYKTSDGLKKAIKDARENRKLDRMQRAGAGNKKAPDYYKGAEALSW